MASDPFAPGGFGNTSSLGGAPDTFSSAYNAPSGFGDLGAVGGAPADFSQGFQGDAWGTSSVGGLGPAGATDFASASSMPSMAPPPAFDAGTAATAAGSMASAVASAMPAPDIGALGAGMMASGGMMAAGAALDASMTGSASDFMAQSAPALQDLSQDLSAKKDHLVGAVTAAAAAKLGGIQAAPSGVEFKITVTDPVKQGDGMRAYISYKINTKTNLPQYQWKDFSMIHRYSDFVWLHGQLKEKYAHAIIPPLPDKAVTGNFEPSFIQLRRAALEKFLQRVASHPVLQKSEDLQVFLEASDEVLQAAKNCVSTKETTTVGAKKKKGGFFQWFKEVGQEISNSVGKVPEEFHDAEYEGQKVKVEELKNQVVALQRYTMRLVHRQRELSAIMTEFGLECNNYATIEQGRLKHCFSRVATTVEDVSNKTGEHASVVEQELDAVLQESVRMLDAVGDLFANRQAAIVGLQTARGTHEGKNKQYNSVANDPRKLGKANELSREVQESEAEEKMHKEHYDLVSESTATELERFQKERQEDFKNMLMGFAKCNAEYHHIIATKWADCHRQLEAEFSSM